jgi:hypothetical protein
MNIDTALNSHPELLQAGNRVTTAFHSGSCEVVRTITEIKPDRMCGSGFRASADGGGKCPTCHRELAIPVFGVDAAWFVPLVGIGGET